MGQKQASRPLFRLTIQPACLWLPVPASFGQLLTGTTLFMALCDVCANVNVVLLLCIGLISLCVQIVCTIA